MQLIDFIAIEFLILPWQMCHSTEKKKTEKNHAEAPVLQEAICKNIFPYQLKHFVVLYQADIKVSPQ